MPNHIKFIVAKKINDNVVAFTREGRWNVTDAEPTLFPSCDNRDWGKFDIPDQNIAERQLKPFDEVLVRDSDDSKLVCDFSREYLHREYMSIRVF